MLRLLLDENISRKVALAAKKRSPAMEIVSKFTIGKAGGSWPRDDGEILKDGCFAATTLVTYDQSTLLNAHGGAGFRGLRPRRNHRC